jgi:hypothetical protein
MLNNTVIQAEPSKYHLNTISTDRKIEKATKAETEEEMQQR